MIQDNRPVHFIQTYWSIATADIVVSKPLPPSWKGKLSQKIGELAKLPIEILPDLRPMDESDEVVAVGAAVVDDWQALLLDICRIR